MIELVNWSGHENLGDDAMAKILLDEIPGAVNVGEAPTGHADGYIVGGGTLLSPSSMYIGITPPEKTIVVSIGVSEDWHGNGMEWLKLCRRVYARDFYTHKRLNDYSIPNTLSVDLCCFLKAPKRKRARIMANIMMIPGQGGEGVQWLNRKELDYFAMCSKEDLDTVPNAKLYTDAKALIGDFAECETVIATRLHANVLAWVAKVPAIIPIVYANKINHFFERVKGLTQEEARKIITTHLNEIKYLVQHD